MDKYQAVRFDRNSYSVPRGWAFRAVAVKGYVDRVGVVGDGPRLPPTPGASGADTRSSSHFISWGGSTSRAHWITPRCTAIGRSRPCSPRSGPPSSRGSGRVSARGT
ncbi:Mu transposase domain-containing protein, partial [Gemmata algarum]|uniref:Mu transposase domain-containing protein n=1 Tax=Gemmata algarum TaxID=2975278 RepID=UPI0039C92C86